MLKKVNKYFQKSSFLRDEESKTTSRIALWCTFLSDPLHGLCSSCCCWHADCSIQEHTNEPGNWDLTKESRRQMGASGWSVVKGLYKSFGCPAWQDTLTHLRHTNETNVLTREEAIDQTSCTLFNEECIPSRTKDNKAKMNGAKW